MPKNNVLQEAAFLVRCSTDKQDYDRQIQDLTVVAERFGLHVSDSNIYGEYITGKDDTTKQDRLSVRRCRNAAEEHKYKYLLVAEVSRMSRDSVSGRVYVRQFCNLRIPIYFRDKMKWTMNPETLDIDESFIKELGLYFDGAAEYLKSMKTQIASGRRARLRNNGLIIGHVPLGYKKRGGKDRNTKYELVIDEKTAPVVKDIFTMYLADEASMSSVSKAISVKYGIRKTVSGVQQVLARKEYYTGEYTVYLSDPDDKNKAPEPFTITFEPLISKETYEAAESKRKSNKSSREPYPKQMRHPLSRLIKCPFCGHSFSPRARSGDKPGEKYRIINGKIAYSWICMTRINNAGECISHVNLNDEKTETIVWELIKRELLDFADLHKDTREEKILELRQKIADAKGQIPLYIDSIEKAKARRKRAYHIYLDAADLDEEQAKKDYDETIREVRKQSDSYTSEIETLKRRITSWEESIRYYSQTNITSEYIDSIEDNLEEKRKLFLQLIHKITPYGIRDGVVVIELDTVNGTYYILFDGNQRFAKCVAHYIAAPFAEWHTETDGELKMHERNSYFTLKNTDILAKVDDIDPDRASFTDMQTFCAANGWVLPYFQIYGLRRGENADNS